MTHPNITIKHMTLDYSLKAYVSDAYLEVLGEIDALTTTIRENKKAYSTASKAERTRLTKLTNACEDRLHLLINKKAEMQANPDHYQDSTLLWLKAIDEDVAELKTKLDAHAQAIANEILAHPLNAMREHGRDAIRAAYEYSLLSRWHKAISKAIRDDINPLTLPQAIRAADDLIRTDALAYLLAEVRQGSISSDPMNNLIQSCQNEVNARYADQRADNTFSRKVYNAFWLGMIDGKKITFANDF